MQEYFEIGKKEECVDFHCTEKGMEMMVHAPVGVALAVGGASIPAIIKAFFNNVVSQAPVPKDVVASVLFAHMEATFKKLGIEMTINTTTDIRQNMDRWFNFEEKEGDEDD